jgi:hypothetical protein
VQVIKVNDWREVQGNYTGIIEYPNGTKKWYLNGKYHREDGPAIIEADGSKRWYLNGMRHREDGPAVEYPNRLKQWWSNGKRLFSLPSEFQPFVLLEEFIDEEGNGRIKVLIQKGIEMWPNVPGLKELAENWEKE